MLHPMERPDAWGTFHTLFFILGIPAAIISAYLLRKLSENAERRLFFGIGIALVLSEIFKQLAYTAIEGAYRFDLIPFQLCSIPMYLCIIIALIPDGRISRAMRMFIATFGLMGGMASYLFPGTMCRDWLELTLHSFLWHLALIFLGFYIFFSRNTEYKRAEFFGSEILYLSLCCIAFTINIICLDSPGADVNMFYIGPKPSTLPICRDITARFGVAVNSLIYIASLSLCAFLIFLTEKRVRKLIK